MDWDLAIKRNSEALKGIIADLFAMLELAGGITVARLPRPLHSAVLRVLCPAESAVRRLIVIAARGLVVKLASLASGLASQAGRAIRPRHRGQQVSLFPALRSAETFQACTAPSKSTRLVPCIVFSPRPDPTGVALWRSARARSRRRSCAAL